MTKKALKIDIALPPGRCSFPFLAKPDSGREYSDDAYKFDHIIAGSTWTSARPKTQKKYDAEVKDRAKKGMPELAPFDKWVKDGQTWKAYVEEALILVASDLLGKKVALKDVKKHFIKELGDDVDAQMKGCVMIRCKNKKNRPGVQDSQGTDLLVEDIAKIKGGDYVQPAVTVYGYSQSGGGVTVGLNMVRFLKVGEPFGAGNARHLGLLDDIEVTADNFGDEDLADYAKSA